MTPQRTTEFEQAAQQSANVGLLTELWQFLAYNKKWWLLPILSVMALLGLVIALSGTGAAPFLYTLF
jgi:hypothetical protein